MRFLVDRKRLLWLTGVGVAIIFLVAGAVAVGFNMHAKFSREFSPGYQAGLFFIPSLSSAYLDYVSREHEIADAVQDLPLIEALEGVRIAVYQPWADYKIPVYDGLKALNLDVSILKPEFDVDDVIERLDIVIFPQGAYHLRQLPNGEKERLREIVNRGVDYIGLCAGTFFAVDELGIAPIEHVSIRMVAIMRMSTLEEDFWGDLSGRPYQVHYANGGLFPADGLGSFQPLVEAENFGYTAVRGQFGLGQVVLFTFHPEGGGLTLNNQSVYFSGRNLGSGKLLLQVLKKLSVPE